MVLSNNPLKYSNGYGFCTKYITMWIVINDAIVIHTYELKQIARDRFFFPPGRKKKGLMPEVRGIFSKIVIKGRGEKEWIGGGEGEGGGWGGEGGGRGGERGVGERIRKDWGWLPSSF